VGTARHDGWHEATPGPPGWRVWISATGRWWAHDPDRATAGAGAHPRSVSIREELLTAAVRQFLAERIFGAQRRDLLAAQIPADAADQAVRDQAATEALNLRLGQIEAAENAHAREIENLATLPQDSPAITALRSRIIARFGELETERTEINERLAALERSTGQQDEPACWTDCPCSATSSPTPRPASKPACSPPSAWN
jgi:hypothetical protein